MTATKLTAKSVAGIITAVWITGVGIFAYWSEAAVIGLKLNELGDFLAGVFAPIAFVWLVVAVWIQSAELKEQRTELQLTREEFKHQRDVMQAQAEEARKQAEFIGIQTKLLEAEEIRRIYAEQDKIFAAHLDAIRGTLRHHLDALSLTDGRDTWFVRPDTGVSETLDHLGTFVFNRVLDILTDVKERDKVEYSDQAGFVTLREQIWTAVEQIDHLSPSMKIQAQKHGFSVVLTGMEMLTERVEGT